MTPDPLPAPGAPRIDMAATPGFAAFLARVGASLIFTSYRRGEAIALGSDARGTLAASATALPRCMGLGVGPNRFWIASEQQLWRFQNFLPPGASHAGHDAVFMPLVARTTGAVDLHDVAEDEAGRAVFASPRYNCLGRACDDHSFEALWRPPFIDALIAEDRCHLNGLAMRDGRARYATCVATTNQSGGWREQREAGGVVIDVATNDIVCAGLSMPHSPRWHDGRLWLLQSGTGEFGHVDLAAGRFEAVCRLPGFARGLSFHAGHAAVGVSLPRHDSGFGGLALEQRLARDGSAPECAVFIVDTATGGIVHKIAIGPDVEEIYDVAFLPGLRNPLLIRQDSDEMRYFIRPGEGPGQHGGAGRCCQ